MQIAPAFPPQILFCSVLMSRCVQGPEDHSEAWQISVRIQRTNKSCYTHGDNLLQQKGTDQNQQKEKTLP